MGFVSLDTLPYLVITVVIAFSVHEFAHAYVATKFGDPTPGNQGRLTLNPVAHIDLVGFIFILLAGFGWAKPVQVNPYYFKNRRLAGVMTSLAGPLSNFLMALVGSILFAIVTQLVGVPGEVVAKFFYYFVYMNLVLMIFNLIPLPPLDGYRIVEDLVSRETKSKMTQYEQYGVFAFLVIVLIPPLNALIIAPIFDVAVPAVWGVIKSITGLFF